jgi:hypothetical protein
MGRLKEEGGGRRRKKEEEEGVPHSPPLSSPFAFNRAIILITRNHLTT